MKFISTLLLLGTIGISLRAATFTNTPDADSFVRSNAPTANYGGAGALSVSGSISTNTMSGFTNGIADTFIRFKTAAMVTNFNSLFGTNNWVVSGATLQVTEVGTPNNPIFDQGIGAFTISWVADDNWTEGNGTPMMNSTTGGIVYTNEPALLTNTASLGIFTNTSTSVTLLFPLALPRVFTSDVQAGGEVTLFLSAIDPQTGFTFNSRSFGTASARPLLEISAVPVPGISAVSLSGSDVVLSATNGAAGGTYYVLSSTNAALPLNQWNSTATNVLTADGNFNITITNAVSGSTPWQQFFILQTR
jgi:hypothetical protein